MTLSKTEFRKNSLQKIKESQKHNILYKTWLLEKKLYKVLHSKKFRSKNLNILFYYPLHFEANVLKVMKKMRHTCNIYLPFMEGESFKMVPFRLPLSKKKFDIFEAGNTYRIIKKINHQTN